MSPSAPVREDDRPLDAAALRAELRSRWIGWRLECLEETESTNDVARELARRGAPAGTVVLAERQTRGRGRLGRRWESPPRVNLYLSVVLRPHGPQEHVATLPLVAGIAVCAALTRWHPARIKWPNDVLLEGRKVAGILAEHEPAAGTGPAVVLGIGVNVNATPGHFPSELRPHVSSLRMACGRAVRREEVLAALLESLEHWYGRWEADGFPSLVRQWEERCGMIGSRVRVSTPAGTLEGRVLGLRADGALRLEAPGGGEQIVRAGDVALLR